MTNKAIVTLVIGDAFKARWTRICGENWKDYARRHNCDLVLLDEPLDKSQRAQKRSPSWQKCLIFNLPQVKEYKQVAWIDSDILINPDAPDIFDNVADDKVAAVDSFGDPSPEENKVALQRLWSLVRSSSNGTAPGEYNSPEDVYRKYGPPVEPLPRMFNAGVFVASPKHHHALFRHVYEAYEDRGDPSYFENVPLSYELVKRDMVHWLDPKFNHLWAWSKIIHYPFFVDWGKRTIKDKMLRRLALWSGNNYEERVVVACITSALLNCYFLHFAGCANDMDFVDITAAKMKQVRNIGAK